MWEKCCKRGSPKGGDREREAGEIELSEAEHARAALLLESRRETEER